MASWGDIMFAPTLPFLIPRVGVCAVRLSFEAGFPPWEGFPHLGHLFCGVRVKGLRKNRAPPFLGEAVLGRGRVQGSEFSI